MAKRSRPTDPRVEGRSRPEDGDNVRKRSRRLERKIAELEATEAKRVEQLEKVRARMADLRARLAALTPAAAAAGPTPASAGSTSGPTGYCMREKRRVQIGDPVPVTLSNGRAATSGTCLTCGARIVALSPRAAPSGG